MGISEGYQPRVRASGIARFLGRPLNGRDIVVRGPSAASAPMPETIAFIKSDSDSLIAGVNAVKDVLVLALPECASKLSVPYIVTDTPRLSFAKAVRAFFVSLPPPAIASTARVADTAIIGSDVSIGEYSVVGDHVVIGERTIIGNHVSIGGQARIGQECTIKTHAVIGEEGFGFEMDEMGHPIRLPHLGSVVIGDHVDIGSFTTVVRGTIGPTTLHDWVKVDDHVHVAHNVTIGEGAFVIACAEVSGGVVVGAGAWMAPQASTLDGIKIGEGAQIGLGAVVTKDVEPHTVVVGNPARIIRRREP